MRIKIYLLIIVLLITISTLFSQPTSKIYYSQYSLTQMNIYRANLDGSNEITIPMPIRPKAIAVDWKSVPQKLYIGLIEYTGDSKIIRCDVDGSNQEDVVTNQIGLTAMALDLLNRKIYWLQDTYDDDRIFRANMDSLNSSIQQIYSATASSRDLWGITLDVVTSRVWFTERGGNCYSSYIKRMNTDGSGLTIILNPVCNPHDIEYFNGKLFWGDLDGLEKANTDGSGIETIVSPAKIDGLSIDATNNKIYWVDYSADLVKCVGVDGSNETTISSSHISLSRIDTDFNPAITDIESPELQLFSFILSQNYPNPFNPSTKIKYEIPGQARNDNILVTLKVYDVLGNEVATLVNEEKPAGEYEVEFSSHSDEGQNLSSGVYFYQLQSGDFVQTKKMILMK